MRLKHEKHRIGSMLMAIIVLFVAFNITLCSPVFAQSTGDSDICYDEDGAFGKQLSLPIYHWWRQGYAPKAAVIAVHGLIMHGRSFDTMARTLVGEGFEVFATDLRGHGRSMSAQHTYCRSHDDCRQKIDYERSYDDVVQIAQCLRTRNPGVPIFAVGESLGGAMIIRLAAKHPDLLDGLVLSAPAIKRHSFIDPYMVANGALLLSNPRAQLDLMPFVRKFASDDPRVIAEKEEDPLLRRRLNAAELMQSSLVVRKTITFVEEIPTAMPVLVIQGGADRCIKANAIILLLAHLRSADQTVKWFHQRGHILLETAYVKPDTMDAVLSWLMAHAQSPVVQAHCRESSDLVAGDPTRTEEMFQGERSTRIVELQ